MGPTHNPRLLAALLIGGLALALVGAPPAPVPGDDCGCCDGGTCLLAAGGCDHRQAAQRQLTSCCIGSAEPLGPVASRGLSELDAAILSVGSAPATAVLVTLRFQPAPRLPNAPVLHPEPPPPRSPSARNA